MLQTFNFLLAGYQSKKLQRPIIFLGKIPEELIGSLRTTAFQHGGLLCGSPELATHIVDWDEEVDTLPDDLTEEYVRTLELRPLENGGVARVHWYYFPDCYDEWISSQDVDAVDPPDCYQHHSIADKDTDFSDKLHQPWRVCCRFIRDCGTFNEWGNEFDYEIVDDSGNGTPMDEDDGSGAGAGAGVSVTPGSASSHKANRSPGSGRKARKSDVGSQIAASTNASKRLPARKDIPVMESTNSCTDRMMQNAAPPSKDRVRDTFTVVDIVSPVNGAPGSYPGSGITSQSYTLSKEPTNAFSIATSSAAAAAGTGASANKQESSGSSGDDVIESKSNDDSPSQQQPPSKKRKADDTDTAANEAVPSVGSTAAAPIVDVIAKADSPMIPAWFDHESISSMEVRYLPALFTQDFSSEARDTYLALRTAIINMYTQSPFVYLSATDCRRRLSGNPLDLLVVYLHSLCI